MANYRFGTWNIGTLKGRSGEVCEVLRRRLRFAVSMRYDGKVRAPEHFRGISLYGKGTVREQQELEY